MFKDNLIKFLLIFFVVSQTIFAQLETTAVDSVDLSDSVFVMRKSPMGAVLRSAILPGWGQIYNESYWKAPIIWAIGGYLVYGWITTNDLYQNYKSLYAESLTNSSGNYVYKAWRNTYRDRRDLFAVYLGLTYFLNLVDAYVDGQLYDFQYLFNNATLSPELGVRIKLN